MAVLELRELPASARIKCECHDTCLHLFFLRRTWVASSTHMATHGCLSCQFQRTWHSFLAYTHTDIHRHLWKKKKKKM